MSITKGTRNLLQPRATYMHEDVKTVGT